MSRLNDGVGIEFAKVFHLLDSIILLFHFGACFYIGVSCACFNRVTDLLAAGAPDVLFALIFVRLIILLVFLFLVFAIVLAFVAPRCFLAGLATAPPHFAAVVTPMSFTAPVEVFLFTKLLAAILAGLETRVKLALALNELLDPQLRFLFLHGKLLASFLKCQDLFQVVVVVLIGLGQKLCQLHLSFLVLNFVMCVVLFNDSFVLVQISCVLSKLVSLLNKFGRLSLHLPDTR